MDTNANQAARESQDSQMAALNGMAEFVRIIAELLAKLSGQDIKLDDLTLRSGTKKVWPSNDENFELTAKLKNALVDPESKASFRVMLEYADGSKVEIFRQTAGKVIMDEYGLAPALRAHFAAEAAAKFAEVQRPKIVIEADGLDNVATASDKDYTFLQQDGKDSISHKDRGIVFESGKFTEGATVEDTSALEALDKYRPLVEVGSTFLVQDGYTTISSPKNELMVLHPDRGIVLQKGEFTANAIDSDKAKLDISMGIAPGNAAQESPVTQVVDLSAPNQNAKVGTTPLSEVEVAALATEFGQKLEAKAPQIQLKTEPVAKTYSQQRETARLDDVLGQIAELDRRAAAGMSYIADPAQNQGYKALQDEAIALKAKLGITEPQSVNTEIADLNAEFQKEAAALRSELEAPDSQDAKTETVAQANPVTTDKPISQVKLNEAAILGAIAAPSTEAISSGVNAKDLTQESNVARFSVAAAAIAASASSTEVSMVENLTAEQFASLQTEKTSSPQEKNEAFVMDGVRNAALDYDREPFGRLAENAVNTIAYEEIAASNPPIYYEAYIPPIEKLKNLDEFTGQTIDITPLNAAPADSDGAINSVSIQPFLAEVSALSAQIETLREKANEKLGQVMHLSTVIVAEAQTPDIERWSEQVGTVAQATAQSWGDRLREAASFAVDIVKERAANDWQIVVDTVTDKATEVKEFVQERAATDWDATKEVVQDRAANDWQTTKGFIAEKATDAWIGVQEWALGSADVNKSIDALVGAMAEGEPTHGMIEHNGYIIARQGEDRGVFRAEDKVAVFKDGLLTRDARSQDSAYVSKLPQFSAEVNRVAETLEKHNSASENASRSTAPSMKR